MEGDKIETFKKRLYMTFSLSLMFIGTTLITRFWGIADYHFILPNAATAIISIFILRTVYKGWGSKSIAKIKKVNRNIIVLLLLVVYLIDIEIRGGNIMGAAAGDAAGAIMVIQMIANRFM